MISYSSTMLNGRGCEAPAAHFSLQSFYTEETSRSVIPGRRNPSMRLPGIRADVLLPSTTTLYYMPVNRCPTTTAVLNPDTYRYLLLLDRALHESSSSIYWAVIDFFYYTHCSSTARSTKHSCNTIESERAREEGALTLPLSPSSQ